MYLIITQLSYLFWKQLWKFTLNSLSLCVSLSLFFSFSLSLPFSVSVCLCFSHPLCCLCISLYLYHFLAILSLYLSVPLSTFPPPSLIHSHYRLLYCFRNIHPTDCVTLFRVKSHVVPPLS